jgi:hypothetical protein
MKGRHDGDQRILKGGVVMWAVGAGPAEAPRGGTGTQGGVQRGGRLACSDSRTAVAGGRWCRGTTQAHARGQVRQ